MAARIDLQLLHELGGPTGQVTHDLPLSRDGLAERAGRPAAERLALLAGELAADVDELGDVVGVPACELV